MGRRGEVGREDLKGEEGCQGRDMRGEWSGEGRGARSGWGDMREVGKGIWMNEEIGGVSSEVRKVSGK